MGKNQATAKEQIMELANEIKFTEKLPRYTDSKTIFIAVEELSQVFFMEEDKVHNLKNLVHHSTVDFKDTLDFILSQALLNYEFEKCSTNSDLDCIELIFSSASSVAKVTKNVKIHKRFLY